jgi:enoyl-CoA hydratase/carnithine racemase
VLLLGKLFDATYAHSIGLINRVVDDEPALETEIRTIVSSLLQGAPDAVAATKKLITQMWPVAIDDDLKRASDYHLSARDSAEAREGIAAFNEKRAPKWAP